MCAQNGIFHYGCTRGYARLIIVCVCVCEMHYLQIVLMSKFIYIFYMLCFKMNLEYACIEIYIIDSVNLSMLMCVLLLLLICTVLRAHIIVVMVLYKINYYYHWWWVGRMGRRKMKALDQTLITVSFFVPVKIITHNTQCSFYCICSFFIMLEDQNKQQLHIRYECKFIQFFLVWLSALLLVTGNRGSVYLLIYASLC